MLATENQILVFGSIIGNHDELENAQESLGTRIMYTTKEMTNNGKTFLNMKWLTVDG